MKKLVLLFMLLCALRSFGAVATNVQNLSQFGTTNRAMPGDGIGLSTRYATGSERLMGIQVTNLIKSLNALGVGTNTVLIAAGTNVVISTNRTSSNVTYTVSVTNSFSTADVVWTNNGGIIHPVVLNGQQTNSIQIYTNGGLSIGANTLPYWVTQPGFGGETLVSMRDSTIDFNEIFIGVPSLVTNDVFQDFFMHSGLNRRRIILELPGEQLIQDQYIDNDTNFVFGASGTSFGDVWKFQPGEISASQYFFDTVRPVATNVHLMNINNWGTNKFVVRGDSHVGINTNEPSYPLHIFNDNISKPSIEISYATGAGNTTAFQVRNGAGSTNFKVGVDGLVDSATIHNTGTITSDVVTATSLNVLGGTLGAGKVLTDTGGTGAATWQTPSTSLSGTTNFLNLSVQAAKITTTNFPAFDTGYQDWELVFFPTNESGSAFPLPATWQFVVPNDYATNSLQVYMLQTLVETNGPNSSNTIWRASIFKATPSDSTDVRFGSFGATVWATNTWGASGSNTNKIQSLTIDLSTNSLLQAGDLAIVKIERVNTNESYRGSSSLVGLQLRYTRP